MQQAYTLATNDQVLTAKGYEDLIIAYRNGAPVRLRDIGHAEVAAEDVTLHGWYNDKPSVILAIQRQPGANVISTVDGIKKLLPQLVAGLPSDIKVTIASDRTQTIRASVADVQFTLLLTIALVVGVIFLFLRNFWATIIPAISVPISLIGTFGVMYLLNYSLDNLSLMGLSIAVGFVVDDAIVMIENITRHIEEGLSPLQAALKGAGEIAFTIMSISVSLVAVFIPLLLMGGVIGRMFQEFAVTVCVAIAVSVIVSVTLTPMMCAYLLSDHGAGTGVVSAHAGTRLRRDPARLRGAAVRRAALQARDADGYARQHHGDRRAVRRHPEGVLSPAGHRHDHRHHGSLRRRFAGPNGGAAAQRDRRDREGSFGRQRHRLYRPGRPHRDRE